MHVNIHIQDRTHTHTHHHTLTVPSILTQITIYNVHTHIQTYLQVRTCQQLHAPTLNHVYLSTLRSCYIMQQRTGFAHGMGTGHALRGNNFQHGFNALHVLPAIHADLQIGYQYIHILTITHKHTDTNTYMHTQTHSSTYKHASLLTYKHKQYITYYYTKR